MKYYLSLAIIALANTDLYSGNAGLVTPPRLAAAHRDEPPALVRRPRPVGILNLGALQALGQALALDVPPAAAHVPPAVVHDAMATGSDTE